MELKNESNPLRRSIQATAGKKRTSVIAVRFRELVPRALLYLRLYEWKTNLEKWINSFLLEKAWRHRNRRCCAPQVFFYRARMRTMGRFHADVSRELGLNNWCWSHYRQASVYAAGGKNDLAARDRQVRGFRYRWTLWDGNTSHPSDRGMRPQSERMFDTSNQCRWLRHLSWWLMWERTVSGNVLCSQNKFRCVGYCKKFNKYLQAGILKYREVFTFREMNAQLVVY